MTLRIPSYAQAKAFYVLPAIGPAAAWLALGSVWIGHRRVLSVAFAALMFFWAATSYAALWVVDDAAAFTTLGLSELGGGHPTAAERDFRAALARKPAATPAHMGLAHSLEAQGRRSEAAEQAAAALAADPGDPDALLFEVARRADAGDLAGAEAAARAAHARAPDEPRALAALASILADRGRSEEAVAALRDLLAIVPDDAPTHRELARLYALLGRPEAAAAHRRTAARIAAVTGQGPPAESE